MMFTKILKSNNKIIIIRVNSTKISFLISTMNLFEHVPIFLSQCLKNHILFLSTETNFVSTIKTHNTEIKYE